MPILCITINPSLEHTAIGTMASMKAERTVSSQEPKEPAKAADSMSKASKPGPKKAEQKPQPKRKAAPKVSERTFTSLQSFCKINIHKSFKFFVLFVQAKGGKPAAAKN